MSNHKIARAQNALKLAGAVKAASLAVNSAVNADDPTDKGVKSVTFGDKAAVKSTLPAEATVAGAPTAGDNKGTSLPAGLDRTYTPGSTEGVAGRNPTEGSALLNSVIKTAAAKVNAGNKAADKAAANTQTIELGGQRRIFEKLAHAMLQTESGRTMVEGWLQRTHAEKVASDLFNGASAFSDEVAVAEKRAAVEHNERVKFANLVASLPVETRAQFIAATAAHDKALRDLAADTVKFANAKGLTRAEAEELFSVKRAAYVKAAAEAEEALEGGAADSEEELPVSAGEQPAVNDEDVVAVLQQLVAAGMITPEAAEDYLQQAAGEGAPAEGGGAAEGGAPAGGEGAPAEGGAPEDPAVTGEKTASFADHVLARAIELDAKA